MSGKKEYLIYRKQIQPKMTEIPKSTYVAETFVSNVKVEPIHVPEYFETLSKPKQIPPPPPPEPLPKYENPPPDFSPVDYRTNKAALHHDLYVLKKMQKLEDDAKENSPQEFLEWQKKMREQDEEERRIAVQERREDLDNCRKRAIKAKKREIAEKLEVGRKMRIDFGEDIANVRDEIEREREKIRELKKEMKDNTGVALARLKRQKILESREVRKTLRHELKVAAKLRAEEAKAIHDNAVKVRDQLQNHTNKHGDAFVGKVDITDTTYLAALSDEEAQQLLANHAEQKRKDIEKAIEEHRAIKEKKMQELVDMLNEATRIREQKAEEYERLRKEKQEAQQREQQRKEEEEAQKMLELEKKLEKKRQQRIQEAAEMEEHTRQIDARTRYLALNKKAMATKTFQSQQDGRLRAARDRQSLAMNDNNLEKSTTRKPMKSTELKTLKGLLGI